MAEVFQAEREHGAMGGGGGAKRVQSATIRSHDPIINWRILGCWRRSKEFENESGRRQRQRGGQGL